MTDLQSLITHLSEGRVDEILKGTKYGPNPYPSKQVWFDRRAKEIDPFVTTNFALTVKDAKANAARVVVLERAVRELREALEKQLICADVCACPERQLLSLTSPLVEEGKK